MKKAILMTWYNSNNYGTLLQSYATKEIFKERYGVECYFVNYIPKGKRDIISVIRKLMSVKSWKRQITIKYDAYMLKHCGISKLIDKRNQWVKEFISHYKYVNNGLEVKSDNDFKNLADEFDFFISGSDQIWNPKTLNEHFLLDFVPSDKNCISFASSLSAEKIPNKSVDIFKKQLKKYNGVTIRESSCEQQLRDIFCKCGQPADRIGTICDPTLLYGADKWLELLHPNAKSNYVLLYMLGKSQSARTVAKNFAEKNDMGFYTFPFLSSHYVKEDRIFKEEEQLWETSPFEWISWIKNANLIITDSFHMTAFSIMLHKNFYVVEKDGTEKSQNNRIVNLLSMVGLEKRFLMNGIKLENISDKTDSINWVKVDDILQQKRDESFALVDKIMKDIL